MTNTGLILIDETVEFCGVDAVLKKTVKLKAF